MARLSIVHVVVALACVTHSLSVPPTMREWQSNRLQRFSAAFDASRYHVQVLLVDDDGVSARTCEALLERVAIWADAGWWIWPSSASIGDGVTEGGRTAAGLPSLQASFSQLGLCNSRLQAAQTQLDPSDLVAGYDLILCLDFEILDKVRELAREHDADESSLLCLADFLACGGDRMSCLDDELRSVVAPHYATASASWELPMAVPANRDDWERFLAASTLSCAGVVTFLKDAIDDFFLSSYQRLLEVHYDSPAAARTPWSEAEPLLRRYEVTGGLDPRVRRELFEAHCAKLLQVPGNGGDTSDGQGGDAVDDNDGRDASAADSPGSSGAGPRGGSPRMLMDCSAALTHAVDHTGDESQVDASTAPSWESLTARVLASATGARLAAEAADRALGGGPPHIEATSRLFGSTDASQVRVTLYRDAAGWCPYCQRVSLLLEEKRIPYQVEHIPLDAYGFKPTSFTRRVENGQLPALMLDGVLHTESEALLALLDSSFAEEELHGPRRLPTCGEAQARARAAHIAELQAELESDWFSFVFYPVAGEALAAARTKLLASLAALDATLAETAPSPWLHGGTEPSVADMRLVTSLERLVASALYWKALQLRGPKAAVDLPRLEAFLAAWEARPSYLSTKGDLYSLVMAMPSQNGPGYAVDAAADVAAAVSGLDGSWALHGARHEDLEPLAPLQLGGGAEAARLEAAYRLCHNAAAVGRFAARAGCEPGTRWHAELAAPDALSDETLLAPVDAALRYVTLALVAGVDEAEAAGAHAELGGLCSPLELDDDWGVYEDLFGRTYYWHELTGESTYTPPTRGLDGCLAYLRDRIGVPRDISAAGARALRAHLNWAVDLLRNGTATAARA